MASNHPSFLALDRFATGGPDPTVAGHVSRCDACRRHVETIGERPALPTWLPTARPRPFAGWRPLALALALGALALALVWWRPPDPPSAPYVGAKGAPAVAVFIKRGERVTRWRDGPLRPADTVRLGLILTERTHVSVYGAGDGARADRLFAGWLDPGAPALLDRAWVLDDAPGPERLWVVMGPTPLDAPQLIPGRDLAWLALRPATRVEALVLHKEAGDE